MDVLIGGSILVDTPFTEYWRMNMVYGYCRISTGKQSIDRQIRNIKATYPEAIIVEEVYTGTKFQGRDKLDKIIKTVKAVTLYLRVWRNWQTR